MSRIQIQCDQCFEQFEVTSTAKGLKRKCPACGAINRVNSSTAVAEPARNRSGKTPKAERETTKPARRPRQTSGKSRRETRTAIPWRLVLLIGVACVFLVGVVGGVIYLVANPGTAPEEAPTAAVLSSTVALGGVSGNVVSMSFSPDGEQLVCGTNDGQLLFWKTGESTPAGSIKADDKAVVGIAFSPDGMLIATAGASGVKLWDASSRAAVAELPIPPEKGGIQSLAFSSDQKYLAGTGGGMLSPVEGKPAFAVWDVVQRTMISNDWPQRPSGRCLAFAPQGTLLAVGGGGFGRDFATSGNITLVDVATGAVVGSLGSASRGGYVGSMAFSPNGQWLATGTVDTEPLVAGVKGLNANQSDVTIWDVATKMPGCTLKGHFKQHLSIGFLDNTRLAIAGGNPFPTMKTGGVCILSLNDCKLGSEPNKGLVQVQCLAYSPKKQALAWAAADVLDMPREASNVRVVPWR